MNPVAAETPKAARSWSRIDGIDILRGLAIFFVLMNHVNMRLLIAHVPYTKFLPTQLVYLLVWNGELGVQIFFAVSGFLIMSISLRRWTPIHEIRVRDFYLLRFARIAPLMLLLLAVLSGLDLARIHDFVITERTGGLGRALLAALTFRINVLEARTWYLPGNWDILWSLSVEEMFYLFFPLVCWIFGRSRAFVGILLAFVVLGPFGRTVFTHGNEVWRDYNYLGGMEGIALGCLTALIASRIRFSRSGLRIAAAVGMVIVALSLIFSRQTYHDWLGRAGLNMTVLGVGTCLVIIAAAQSQWKSPRIFSPLLSIGRHSYEIYLTHMFVVFALFGLFLRLRKPMFLVPVLFVATIIVAAVLGRAVANFYSEPMNRWLRNRWREGAKNLGSVIEVDAAPVEKVAAV